MKNFNESKMKLVKTEIKNGVLNNTYKYGHIIVNVKKFNDFIEDDECIIISLEHCIKSKVLIKEISKHFGIDGKEACDICRNVIGGRLSA